MGLRGTHYLYRPSRYNHHIIMSIILKGFAWCICPHHGEIFQDDLAADFASSLSQSAAANAALKSIDLILHKHGRPIDKYGLPKVYHKNTEYDRLLEASPNEKSKNKSINLFPTLLNNRESSITQPHSTSHNKKAAST